MRHQSKDFETGLRVLAQKIGETYAFPRGGTRVEARQIANYLLDEEVRVLPLVADSTFSLVWRGVPVSNLRLNSPQSISVYSHNPTVEELGLTQRQLETAACLVSYDSTQSLVSQRLCVPQYTAKYRLAELYAALGVKNQTQAAVKSLRTGLLHIEEVNR